MSVAISLLPLLTTWTLSVLPWLPPGHSQSSKAADASVGKNAFPQNGSTSCASIQEGQSYLVFIRFGTCQTLYSSHLDEKKKNVSLCACLRLIAFARTCMIHNTAPQEKMLHHSVLVSFSTHHECQNKLTTSIKAPLYVHLHNRVGGPHPTVKLEKHKLKRRVGEPPFLKHLLPPSASGLSQSPCRGKANPKEFRYSELIRAARGNRQ